jgi:hypothetical protein
LYCLSSFSLHAPNASSRMGLLFAVPLYFTNHTDATDECVEVDDDAVVVVVTDKSSTDVPVFDTDHNRPRPLRLSRKYTLTSLLLVTVAPDCEGKRTFSSRVLLASMSMTACHDAWVRQAAGFELLPLSIPLPLLADKAKSWKQVHVSRPWPGSVRGRPVIETYESQATSRRGGPRRWPRQ